VGCLDQELSCIIGSKIRYPAEGFYLADVGTSFGVSAGDNDISMRAVWEVFAKADCRVISIIEEKQPLFMRVGQPIKGVLVRVPLLFDEGDIFEVFNDCIIRACIDEECFRESDLGVNTGSPIGQNTITYRLGEMST
jgi:hypothetical protein